MAIQEIQGDLLEIAKTGIIVQQVNCQNAMGAGFAKAIYTKYPIVKERYHKYCDRASSPKALLGDYQCVQVAEELWVINSFTQLYYGRKPGVVYTSEDLLIHNLLNIHNHNKKSPDRPLYIPRKIGCNLGGGNWDNILTAIQHTDYIIVDYKK